MYYAVGARSHGLMEHWKQKLLNTYQFFKFCVTSPTCKSCRGRQTADKVLILTSNDTISDVETYKWWWKGTCKVSQRCQKCTDYSDRPAAISVNKRPDNWTCKYMQTWPQHLLNIRSVSRLNIISLNVQRIVFTTISLNIQRSNSKWAAARETINF